MSRTLSLVVLLLAFASTADSADPHEALAPDEFDRAGMWINLAGDAFSVADVTADGPAAEAGLNPGDLTTAIDGKKASELTLPAARLRLRCDPPGTRVVVSVRTSGVDREVVLTLRDLI